MSTNNVVFSHELTVRALFDLLGEDMIRLVLDKANGYLWKECYRQQSQRCLPGGDDVDGTLALDSDPVNF